MNEPKPIEINGQKLCDTIQGEIDGANRSLLQTRAMLYEITKQETALVSKIETLNRMLQQAIVTEPVKTEEREG